MYFIISNSACGSCQPTYEVARPARRRKRVNTIVRFETDLQTWQDKVFWFRAKLRRFALSKIPKWCGSSSKNGRLSSANGKIPRAMMQKSHKRVGNYLFLNRIAGKPPKRRKSTEYGLHGCFCSVLDAQHTTKMVDSEPNRKVERPKKAVKSGNDVTGLGSDFKLRRRTVNRLFGISVGWKYWVLDCKIT